MSFQTPSSESRAAMDQILSSNATASSSTSSVSISQNPVEQIPKEEPSDQLKNGGEADQLKDIGEADRTKGLDAETPRGKEVVEGEEEEGECGFCLFMKGGGCRDSFTEWEKCMEEAKKKEEDVVEKCLEITSNLKKCMEAHAEYYDPIIRVEKAAEEEVTKELERQAEKKKKDAAPDSST